MVKYQGYILQRFKDRLEAIDDILRIFLEDSSILKVSLINLVEKTLDFIRYALDRPLERVIGMSNVGQYNRSGSAVDPLRVNNAPIDLASAFQFPLSTPYWQGFLNNVTSAGVIKDQNSKRRFNNQDSFQHLVS